ncbi:DUF1592 domain-containing protein [Aeoliella mucimassa]|uniref:PA14 domain protein n=1 Tax=Aeoliella mucimassa TaxID=2527972 RepID=A0A518AH15_9BACT|nr:DUF1592 domain-containing protein [Aeoliella mucimassa]QDU53999.1 PA14 domain protein [Aeoliella mucimassa]
MITTRRRLRGGLIVLLVALGICPVVSQYAFANDLGKQIYADQCAHCHGEQGRGTEDYPSPLEGELSSLQLAEQVRLTMPEDNPESLTRDEARAVADYVHGSFYSAIAQARDQQARVELARLTVRQYRRVVADLVESFQYHTNWNQPGGLEAMYFNGHQPQWGDKAVLKRVDPTVDFDFGTEVPVAECENPQEYSMRWTGSVLAGETGWHEFVVTTDQAFRLFVNDNEKAMIDAWVKSGDDTEFRAKVYLMGGRAYPIKLEFSRGNQGVQDKNLKDKFQKTTPASVHLQWVPPHGAMTVIPSRMLSPASSPESFVCTTPFPPDDRSYGWERGTTTSRQWFEAVTSAAIETTNYVADHLNRLANTKDDDEARAEKLKTFCAQFVERALRRPLDEDLRLFYVDRHFAEVDDPEVATRRVLLMTLTSARFLFREASGGTPLDDTAARLSFTLWDSLPDNELREAASEERLASDEQLRDQAERMLSDLRAHWKIRQFLFTWLHVDMDVDLHKDSQRFPDFDAAIVGDLRTSLDLAIDDIVWSEASDYRQLFLDDHVFLNNRLAKFYGVDPAEDGGFAKIELDAGRRAGVLTHPYVMSNFAHTDMTSPIHRGVFLVRGVLGQPLKPPPEAVAPLPIDLHPDLTTRERVTLQTKPPSCMTCHHVINPLGFVFERFDAVGRWRDTERDKPIDDRAEYQPADAPLVEFAGARDMAQYLAKSDEASHAFVEQMFRFLVQQPVQAYGPEVEQQLHQSFVDNGYSIRKLAVEIAVVAGRTGR